MQDGKGITPAKGGDNPEGKDNRDSEIVDGGE
jgi:hypothetical protein